MESDDEPIHDFMGTDDLADAYGGYWGEHPDHPLTDWRHEVENNYTRCGYWDWVFNQLEG